MSPGHLWLLVLLAASSLWPGALNGHSVVPEPARTVALKAPAPAPVKSADAGFPLVGAKSALLVDLPSGQVLYDKDADTARPIASLAKLMTALLVVERTKPDTVVTIPNTHN